MSIFNKRNNTYNPIVNAYLKKEGVYSAVLGVYEKVDGAYVLVSSSKTNVLRAVSAHNRIATKTQASTGTSTRLAQRYVHRIGSGDVDGIRVIFNNFYGAPSGVANPGNTATWSSFNLEHFGLNQTQPFTVDGVNSYVMANGESEKLSDVILPSAFGLTKFTVNDLVCVRAFVDVPALGNWVVGNYYDYGGGISTARMYDPAATTCTNIGGTGALSFTGTSPTNAGAVPMMLVGTFVSGDPDTNGVCGDSIPEGYTDTTGANAFLGTGFFSRAQVNSGVSPIGCMNLGVLNSTPLLWTNGAATMNKFVKYCNKFAYTMDTNLFTPGANNPTALSNAIAGDRALYTQLRNNQAPAAPGLATFKLLGGGLMRRTTSTDGWTTTVNQTVAGANWDLGGDVFALNAARAADVGVPGRLDGYIDPSPFIAASTNPADADYAKWKPNKAADQLHPNASGHSDYAVGFRSALIAL